MQQPPSSRGLIPGTSPLTKTAYSPLGGGRKGLKSKPCLGWKAAAACSQPLRPCALLPRAKVRAVFLTAPLPLQQDSPSTQEETAFDVTATIAYPGYKLLMSI